MDHFAGKRGRNCEGDAGHALSDPKGCLRAFNSNKFDGPSGKVGVAAWKQCSIQTVCIFYKYAINKFVKLMNEWIIVIMINFNEL